MIDAEHTTAHSVKESGVVQLTITEERDSLSDTYWTMILCGSDDAHNHCRLTYDRFALDRYLEWCVAKFPTNLVVVWNVADRVAL